MTSTNQTTSPTLSVGEFVMARMAMNYVLNQLSDEQMRKSLREAVDKTVAGEPVEPAINSNREEVAKNEQARN